MLVALLVGLVGERINGAGQIIATATAAIAASLDALDGWLARKTNTTSDFGARFDMETDALLILTLSALAWQFDKAGPWVLLSGFLRYGFIGASMVLPWMRSPLPARFRRKAVAAVQMAALVVVIFPPVAPAYSAPIAALALGLLAISFALDVRWLMQQPAQTPAVASEP